MSPIHSGRPEAAAVLMLVQATFWFGAGMSALPVVLGGEILLIASAVASALLAAAACLLAIAVVHRRARRWAITLEAVCLLGSLLQLALPIGANRGPVSLLVNVALPAAVVFLLRGAGMAEHFGIAGARPR